MLFCRCLIPAAAIAAAVASFTGCSVHPEASSNVAPAPSFGHPAPNNRIGFLLIKGDQGSDDYLVEDQGALAVFDGEFELNDPAVCRLVDKPHRIETLYQPKGMSVYQINVHLHAGFAPDRARPVGRPVLIDYANREYMPVGFLSSSFQVRHVRYTPKRPVRDISEVPELAKPDFEGWVALVYLLPKEAHPVVHRVGDTVTARWAEETPRPFHVDMPLRR